MAENVNKRPSKGILKTSASIDIESNDEPSTSRRRQRQQRFDEMNIIATLHPADKDYGHMKIDEPKTPYSEMADFQLNPTDEVDANILAARLAASMNQPPKSESSESDTDSDETEEERQRKAEFEKKRKLHYNEFQAIQLARKLLEDEDEEDCDECKCEETMDVVEEPKKAANSRSNSRTCLTGKQPTP